MTKDGGGVVKMFSSEDKIINITGFMGWERLVEVQSKR